MTALRPLCIVTGWLYTLRYWLKGGVLSFTVDGCAYVEPENPYSLGDFEGQRVEWHRLVCERCGRESKSWRAMA